MRVAALITMPASHILDLSAYTGLIAAHAPYSIEIDRNVSRFPLKRDHVAITGFTILDLRSAGGWQ